jgi:short-subunit dehydrogenase
VTGERAPGLLTKTAEEVAEAGYRGLMRGDRVVVPGAGNKLVTLLARILPRRLLLRLVGARQSRRRAAEPA